MPVLEKQPANAARRQVGYFCHLRIGEKHLGGILITNQIGVPLEFKYTEPVTASKLHKILYGPVLDKYIHETVLRDRLAREVRMEPEYFIAPYEEREFLSSIAGKEMMAVQRFNAAAGEASAPFTRIRDREIIVELEEGPRMMTNIVGCPQTPEALELDMKLEVTFERLDDNITLPLFRPAKG